MSLVHLEVNGFRNLQNITLSPSTAVNLIYGQNASGKTSILEAIYYLSHGRSFITNKINELIHFNSDELKLFSRITNDGDYIVPAGLQHNGEKFTIKIDGQFTRRISDLAKILPVIAIHPESHQLISGGPKQRRHFIDWGLFHVEHQFHQTWSDFNTALKQRNAALRLKQTKKLVKTWDQQLIESALQITYMRQEYLENVQLKLQNYANLVFNDKKVSVEYSRGWNREYELGDLLDKNIVMDSERGFTSVGPQRADIKIRINGLQASTAISRGQQKSLVVLLRLIQAMIFNEHNKHHCLILFDDLPAELDKEHRDILLSIMADMPVQVFITSIEKDAVDLTRWKEKKMFHVEHGSIKELV